MIIMRNRHLLLIGSLLAIVVLSLGGAMGPKIWRVLTRLRAYASMPVYDGSIETNGDYTDIIFLHHSTGRNLIAEGNVRQLLSEKGYRFWDHDYNHIGLTNPEGELTGATYAISGAYGRGNTDVDGLADLFAEPVTDPPGNAFSRLMQHEIIIVKSCFPNSAIRDAQMESQFKEWYLGMREVMDAHPDRLFILLTSPPLHEMETNPEEAQRARSVASWLTSEEFLGGRPNIFTFDLFDLLADPVTNTLRREYWRSPSEADSHPNRAANETIGPLLVSFIEAARADYLDARSQ